MRRGALPWLLAGVLAVLLLLSECGARRLEAESDARVDSIRSEELAAQTSALGWETRFALTTEALTERLLSLMDSTALLGEEKAELARQVELLGGRLALLTDLYAEFRGTIETHDAVVHSSPANITGNIPDSVTAQVNDGTLSGRLVYRPPSTLAVDPYRVALELVLGLAETPDGRALVTARSPNPAVSLRYGDVFWSPPPPVQFCSLGTRLEWGAWGYAGGVATWPLIELVRSIVGG